MDHHPIPASIATGAHLSITVDELMQLRLVALGTRPPSLIIRGANILSLHTSELLERDVVIHGRHIAAITPCKPFSWHFARAATLFPWMDLYLSTS